jgi:hypothetical protein
VATNEIDLELFEFSLIDAGVAQFAESGVYTINRRATPHYSLHQLQRSLHSPAGRRIKMNGKILEYNLVELF